VHNNDEDEDEDDVSRTWETQMIGTSKYNTSIVFPMRGPNIWKRFPRSLIYGFQRKRGDGKK